MDYFIRLRFEPTIYRTRGKHVNHYTTDVVIIVCNSLKYDQILLIVQSEHSRFMVYIDHFCKYKYRTDTQKVLWHSMVNTYMYKCSNWNLSTNFAHVQN
jgi:hypothetical protein